MLKVTIEIVGKTLSDIEIAIDKVKSKISGGFTSEMDSNKDGEYSFSVSGDEEPSMCDKDGNILNVGDTVDVDIPKDGDAWNFDFRGTIVNFDFEDGYVIVEDMNGDSFCVDTDQLLLAD